MLSIAQRQRHLLRPLLGPAEGMSTKYQTCAPPNQGASDPDLQLSATNTSKPHGRIARLHRVHQSDRAWVTPSDLRGQFREPASASLQEPNTNGHAAGN